MGMPGYPQHLVCKMRREVKLTEIPKEDFGPEK